MLCLLLAKLFRSPLSMPSRTSSRCASLQATLLVWWTHETGLSARSANHTGAGEQMRIQEHFVSCFVTAWPGEASLFTQDEWVVDAGHAFSLKTSVAGLARLGHGNDAMLTSTEVSDHRIRLG